MLHIIAVCISCILARLECPVDQSASWTKKWILEIYSVILSSFVALHKCHLISEILSMMTKYLMNSRVTVSKLINNQHSLICPLYATKQRQIACFYWTKWNVMWLNGGCFCLHPCFIALCGVLMRC